MKEGKSIAFFDFDGTITSKDAFLEFISFSISPIKKWGGFLILSPIIFLYFLKIISNEKAKSILFSWFYSGLSEDELKEVCERFFENKLNQLVNKEAISKLEWHKTQQHEVVVVSANFDFILSSWCKKNAVTLISTCVEIKENKVTGNFKGANCYGMEKVSRIKANYELQSYSSIYAYGDSKGDLPMLGLAHFPYYRKFN